MDSSVAIFNPGNASLLQMRSDPAAFPRLKNLPRDKAVTDMAFVVSQAFLYRGQLPDQATIQFIASTLVAELVEGNEYGARNLSMAEIQVVVKRAVLGSEMYGISVASLYRVIIDYAKGEGHSLQLQVQAAMEKAQDDILEARLNSPQMNHMYQQFQKVRK